MPRAITIWGAVLGASRAVWSFHTIPHGLQPIADRSPFMGQTSGEQQRNVPQMGMALRVAARKRVCVVAGLAKGWPLAVPCA